MTISEAPEADFQNIREQAVQLIASLTADNLDQALSWADQMLAHWPPHPSSDKWEGLARLEVLILRAHALRELSTPDRLRESVTAYDQALAKLAELNPTATASTLNQTAGLWMKRGIALLTLADVDSLQQALPCFERAIELRQKLPLESQPWYRYVLCAGWLNRGDVLTRLGGDQNLAEAVYSYDLAIAHLHALPMEKMPEFRWRLAVGWTKRGITHQALNTEAGRHEALRSFDSSLAVLRDHLESPRADYQRILAAAWTNRANLLLSLESPRYQEAGDSARNAIRHTRGTEAGDIIMAEAGIKARHALCRSLAHLLETPPVNPTEAEPWINEATDAVEESLSLSRLWEARGKDDFRTLLDELFHFGTRIYRAFQPHFLAEFLLDGITPAEPNVAVTDPMQSAAQEALSHATLQFRNEGLTGLTPARLDRLLDTLADLRGASEKLVELRQSRSLTGSSAENA